jgi:hypothetical protein
MTALDTLDNGVATVARWGAAVRRNRLLHPAGATFEATFTVTPVRSFGVPLLDEPGTYRAVVRLSKATSTPRTWPDVLGLAWRVVDAGGPGVPLDIALATTGRALLTRHLLVPRHDFDTATFTSLLPYRIGDRNRYLAAVPDHTRPGIPADTASLAARVAARPFVLSIMVAHLTGPWRPAATLRIDRSSDKDPAFDVVANSLPGFAPAGWLNRLRGPAYRGSHQGRASEKPHEKE